MPTAIHQAGDFTIPWVIVAGRVGNLGGTDRANLALVRHLTDRGTPVHLVSHYCDSDLLRKPGLHFYEVALPGGSPLLGDALLAKRANETARRIRATHPTARVLANGGSYISGDLNWVHYVHHAWSGDNPTAPLWYRLKNRLAALRYRRKEREASFAARTIFANSHLTCRHLVEHLGVNSRKIEMVHLGADSDWTPPSTEERRASRQTFGLRQETPVVTFLGGIGHDQRKGFDVLWRAWQKVSADPRWKACLVIAGSGRKLNDYRSEISDCGSVRCLGWTERVFELLAASDLLVSPVRYESYGLNVQEAICRGVPALVSAHAGVAERYPSIVSDLLLQNHEDYTELADRLQRWSTNVAGWRQRILPFSEALRSYSWADMAKRMVDLAENPDEYCQGGTEAIFAI